ncbi:hypothetical protein OIO90_002998 [Microbotryomycetes sp. JL221]|nr:hypothetical protein OIO90_002998 [Microbotryomycetes sp. JL221]
MYMRYNIRTTSETTYTAVMATGGASQKRLDKRRQVAFDGLDALDDRQSRAIYGTRGTAPTAASISPTTKPTAAPVLHGDKLWKRQVVDKWEFSDGVWVINDQWSYRGRTGRAPSTVILDEGDAAMGEANIEVTDQLDPTTTIMTTTSTKLSTARSMSYSTTSRTTTIDYEPHATPKVAAAAPTTSSSQSGFEIPDGWAATPRETGFYAVPIIIAMSVLVAVMVIGTVFGSVLYRRYERNRRKRRRQRKKAAALKAQGIEVNDEKPDDDQGDDALKVAKGKVIQFATKVGMTRRSKHRKAKASTSAFANDDSTTAPVTEATALERTATRGTTSSSGRRTAGEVRAAIVAGSARIRRRRRNRLGVRTSDHPGIDSDESDDDDSMTEALTQSEGATRRGAPETLTARLQARLRDPLNRRPSNSDVNATSATVYSRDLDRTATASTQATVSRLSRTSSRTSQLSIESLSRAVGLGQPTDTDHVLPLHRSATTPSSPALRPSSSSSSTGPAFGAAVADTQLPVLGPPAYRPSSSTLQTPTRFSVSRVPVPRIEINAGPSSSSHAHTSASANDDDQWHWPGEKGRNDAPIASSSSALLPPATPIDDDEEHDDETLPPPPTDRSLYTAHLATDDKAVLARIRQQAEQVAASTSTSRRNAYDDSEDTLEPPSVLALASAPEQGDPFTGQLDDDVDVDEDGFERFPYAESSRSNARNLPQASAPPMLDEEGSNEIEQSSRTASASTSLLPAPPRAVQPSIDYTTLLPTSPGSATTSRVGGRVVLRTSALPSHVEDDDLRQVEERGLLPVYEPARGARGVTTSSWPQPTAPPAEDDEEIDQHSHRRGDEMV